MELLLLEAAGEQLHKTPSASLRPVRFPFSAAPRGIMTDLAVLYRAVLIDLLKDSTIAYHFKIVEDSLQIFCCSL